jgi:DNA-binding Lrp family transcriptional regulator
MAAKAFILIETLVGKTKEVCSALRKLEAAKSVDTVTGPYDIIVTIEGTDLNSIGNLVTNKIHVVPGVIRTVTCLSIHVS